MIAARPVEEGVIKLYGYQDADLTACVADLIAAGLTVPPEWNPRAMLRNMVSMQARQTGKTFGISVEAGIVCCTVRNARCITLSASLRQGAMNIQKDAEVWRTVHGLIRKLYGESRAISTPADDDKGNLIDLDAISDLLENGKLITKFRWGRAASDYSSHEIWAANPDTARGATAQRVFLDEAFTVQEYLEVVRAIKHCIARVKGARFKQKGTPPISSDHPSWEVLYDEATYTPNARGNWRWSNAPGGQGIPILRVDGYDAELAGVASFDDITGEPTTVAEKLAKSGDREGDEREIALKFGSGGNTLIPYSSLKAAQSNMLGSGEAYDLGVISQLNELSDDGLRAALRQMVPASWTRHCTAGDAVGMGHDQSTSDKQGQSNPSAFTVAQESGRYVHQRLIVRWLSKFPRVNEEMFRMLLGDAMRAGLNLRGMGVDASNETFHAQRLQSIFGHLLTVELFKDGAKHPTKDMLWKAHLAEQYALLFTEGLMTLPREGGNSTEWVITDHSLAIKGPRGPEWKTSKGNHFDTGCSGFLATEMLKGAPMPLQVTCVRSSVMHDAAGDDDEDGWQIPAAPVADPIF